MECVHYFVGCNGRTVLLFMIFYELVVSKRLANKIMAAFSDNDGSYLLITLSMCEVIYTGTVYIYIFFFMCVSCFLYANVTLEIKSHITVYHCALFS